MKRKGIIVLAAVVLLTTSFVFSAGSKNPKKAKTEQAPVVTGAPDTLDKAIQTVAVNIESNIPTKSKVAVLNISSPSEHLSDFIIEELIGVLVNDKKLVVADRKELELIRQEMYFQLSGDVSDESAQAIGEMLGAQYIISGTFSDLGGVYRLRVRTINVTTAVIESQTSLSVAESREITFLIEQGKQAAATEKDFGFSLPSPREPTVKSGANYKIGDLGPAGGIVFYDKGIVSDGWRYLEAAPLETEMKLNWLYLEAKHEKIRTSDAVGGGKKNTQVIVDFIEAWEIAYVDSLGIPRTAAHYCEELNYEDFTDWYLPSIAELELMNNNLWKGGWGEFSYMQPYWSSSTTGEIKDGKIVVWVYDFYGDYAQRRGVSAGSYTSFQVRAIRSF